MANSRKDKEAALMALLQGNSAPLQRLKKEDQPLIYIQAEQAGEMIRNVTIKLMTHPQQHLESHDSMTQEAFEAMKQRILKKGQPWIEMRVPEH
ncbi:hypothetical protein BWI93_04515 [Siphonobacter sp. BAB-5385]|uniref:hypothetical protein n=1 Tax=Siphonobacter sp. BAB-5385 TaxID=1864822 RepID=UPI000B9EEAFE|nr:hypothetical protein [Siphonobacter sp. BAB-5385]OZI09327.1 hypothetical protein BWI93_04515 [Siphonobacter sp. BAB-5385]